MASRASPDGDNKHSLSGAPLLGPGTATPSQNIRCCGAWAALGHRICLLCTVRLNSNAQALPRIGFCEWSTLHFVELDKTSCHPFLKQGKNYYLHFMTLFFPKRRACAGVTQALTGDTNTWDRSPEEEGAENPPGSDWCSVWAVPQGAPLRPRLVFH